MGSYQELKTLLVNDEKAAWENLYELYGRKFYSYCIQKWQLNEDDAWDVVYKTLEKLVLKLTAYSFDSQTQFDSFLYTVLINFLREQYRTKKRKEAEQTVYIDFDSESNLNSNLAAHLNQASVSMFFANGVAKNDELLQLSKALDSMSLEEKDLLLLRAQNYSYEEIARLLNIDNNQLKVKHHRAKKKLTELLMQTVNG